MMSCPGLTVGLGGGLVGGTLSTSSHPRWVWGAGQPECFLRTQWALGRGLSGATVASPGASGKPKASVFDLKAITCVLLQPGVLPVFLVKVICSFPSGESRPPGQRPEPGAAENSGPRRQRSAARASPLRAALCPTLRDSTGPCPVTSVPERVTAHWFMQMWLHRPEGGRSEGLRPSLLPPRALLRPQLPLLYRRSRCPGLWLPGPLRTVWEEGKTVRLQVDAHILGGTEGIPDRSRAQ